jgi:predicted nucleotidyltransferase
VGGNGSDFERMQETLKTSAAALRGAEIPFVLAGGLAVWARGGPESDHDLDFMLKPQDAERALQVLGEAGMRTEKPPEGWLYKAFDDDVMVDLIFEPTGVEIDDELLARSDELEVAAVRMKVMSANDVLVTKLLALREHELDFDGVLESARALREQVDWDEVRARTSESPFAKAFFTLAEELGVV